MRAVILAGGFGKRLAPYTTVLPKPLMPVAEYPIIEILLRQLARAGVTHVSIAAGYLAHLIQAYCGDGSRMGLAIDYSLEETPLGTAGPLALIRDLRDSFLVMNGDLLTTLDFAKLFAYHETRGAAMTIAVHEYAYQLPLGAIQTTDDAVVVGYVEKPRQTFDVSMGLYALHARALRYLETGGPFGVPELVARLIDAGELVVAYHNDAVWIDIGRVEDYERAQGLFDSLRDSLF